MSSLGRINFHSSYSVLTLKNILHTLAFDIVFQTTVYLYTKWFLFENESMFPVQYRGGLWKKKKKEGYKHKVGH